MNLGQTLLALTPIAVVFLLMVVLGRSAKLSMSSAYIVTALLALFVWKAPGAVVAAATVNGIVTAITLLFIVFGAVLLLNTLKESGARVFGENLQPAGVMYFPAKRTILSLDARPTEQRAMEAHCSLCGTPLSETLAGVNAGFDTARFARMKEGGTPWTT